MAESLKCYRRMRLSVGDDIVQTARAVNRRQDSRAHMVGGPLAAEDCATPGATGQHGQWKANDRFRIASYPMEDVSEKHKARRRREPGVHSKKIDGMKEPRAGWFPRAGET